MSTIERPGEGLDNGKERWQNNYDETLEKNFEAWKGTPEGELGKLKTTLAEIDETIKRESPQLYEQLDYLAIAQNSDKEVMGRPATQESAAVHASNEIMLKEASEGREAVVAQLTPLLEERDRILERIKELEK